jgi:hypothetical protein
LSVCVYRKLASGGGRERGERERERKGEGGRERARGQRKEERERTRWREKEREEGERERERRGGERDRTCGVNPAEEWFPLHIHANRILFPVPHVNPTHLALIGIKPPPVIKLEVRVIRVIRLILLNA